MIESFPNILVSDVYGSAGGVTAVHKDRKVCLSHGACAGGLAEMMIEIGEPGRGNVKKGKKA